jgi:uncharacterized protein YndB with AHSA1/START domain
MMAAIPSSFSKTITIDASRSMVWEMLTKPDQMRQWMLDDDADVITDWAEGGAFTVRGNLHGHLFENTGTVLVFEQLRRLIYTHRSSISQLPDVPESYTSFEFTLVNGDDRTLLTITCSNFPTESIYKHLHFYWNGTLGKLKRLLEAIG